MAPFEMLMIPIEFIFRSPLGILLMIAISMGLLRLIVWREKMLAAKWSPEDKVRSSQMWSIILVILLIASGCAFYAVRLP